MEIRPISQDMHNQNRPEEICIASYVGPRSFAPETRAALIGLGYPLTSGIALGRFDDPAVQPRLRLVDERQYDRMPSIEEDPDTPMILLTGARPQLIDDARIVGRIGRPAELSELFPIIQRTLEQTPRRAPRVRTQLSARCIRADHRWVGSVVSLSQGGCLFRSSERVARGARMNLQFALPGADLITARAICVHGGSSEAGLAFSETTQQTQSVISGFVAHRLARGAAVASPR
jgi:hypothetical protein